MRGDFSCLIEEEAKVRLFHGPVQVRVFEDDVGTLAPQLQGHPLEVAGPSSLLDQVTDLGTVT